MKEVRSVFDQFLDAIEQYWDKFILILPKLLLAITLVVAVIFIASYLSNLVQKKIFRKAHDPLIVRFITNIIKYAMIVVAFMIGLQLMGLSGIAGGMLAGAGISAFIVGFAFKDIAENFLAGVILAFNRPFAIDDTIKVEEYVGKVIALNFRTTHIKAFDEKDIFIPNSTILKEPLTNLTRNGIIRFEFIVGIAYEDSIEDAIDTIMQTVTATENVLHEPAPFVVAEELSVNTVNLKVLFYVETYDYKRGALIVQSNVIKAVKKTLIEKGFTLPANIQELKLYDKRRSIPVSVMEGKHNR